MTISPQAGPAPGEVGGARLLAEFAAGHRSHFPVVARVGDWAEETSILENHFVKPGVELVIHGWTKQSKIVCEAPSGFYAIPLTYQVTTHCYFNNLFIC